MLRYCMSLAVALSLAAVASAADEGLRIRWHGQSMFEIVTSDGVRIVTDPHAIKEFNPKPVDADLVLMSHFHTDHTQLGIIGNAKSLREGKEIFYGLKKVRSEGRETQEFNTLKETFKKPGCKDVHFYTVGTYHDNQGGAQRGKNGVFVIEADGLRIVHLGDLGHMLTEAQVRRISGADGVDILLIPVGGVYTLNGLDAAKVVEQLKPKRYVIPMHYGIDSVYPDLLSARYFRDEFKREQIQEPDSNELVVDPRAAAPGEPIVVFFKRWTNEK